MSENRLRLTLDFTEQEIEAINTLAAEHGLSRKAVIRVALRLYQHTNHMLKQGETMHWSGDQKRAAEFIGLGFPAPPLKQLAGE